MPRRALLGATEFPSRKPSRPALPRAVPGPLGPASEAAFLRAGITTAEEILAMGADAAYARLLEAGERPHFIGYYVLHMAVQDRSWNSCRGEEKAELRKTFDALKARHFDAGLSRLEAELDALGVGLRR